MRESSLEFLKTLVNTPSPCGYENRGQRVWLDYAKQFADECTADAYGNVVATLNKGGSPRLMLAAHADEIAMAVNYIDDEGFIYVRRIGGVDAAITRTHRITIHTGAGSVVGVVGNVAPHLKKDDNNSKPPKIHELFIDIGAADKKEAEQLVKIGDPITLNQEFELMRNNIAVGRALDNRIGTFAVAETLRLLHEQGGTLNPEICVVSNIMEEIGTYGSRQIAYSLEPDVALVIDVTHATDCPTIDKRQHGDIRLGKGPTITHGTCNHPIIVKRLEQIAESLNIEIQHETISSTSGTDIDAIFWTRGGIPSALVSIPTRYMHSSIEMINLKDLEDIPGILSGFAASLAKGEEFKVTI
ncbi:MAG: M20/M25/M40 family metallo-hydrolase [Verrucomicrobia bacterium]|nr:M20/M25/M40 family metallo-hydrolase [Verrucomicrobiota bacterium]MCF7707769.1 M20/M25/M40 family metallo-hydrolase [Verrucomicrobiota bacterium]